MHHEQPTTVYYFNVSDAFKYALFAIAQPLKYFVRQLLEKTLFVRQLMEKTLSVFVDSGCTIYLF